MAFSISNAWKKIVSIFPVLPVAICTTAYVTWEVRKDYIEDLKNQIATYSQSNKWKLPETLKQLNSVSDKLEKQLIDKKELAALRIESKELRENLQTRTQALEATSNENKKLTTQINAIQEELKRARLSPKEFTINEGGSEVIIKNRVVFGLSGVTSGLVIGNVNNEHVTLRIAGNVEIDSLNERCKLTLINTKPPSASFSFSCDKG